MKKNDGVFALTMVVLTAMLFLGSCTQQSRLIGKWVDDSDPSFVVKLEITKTSFIFDFDGDVTVFEYKIENGVITGFYERSENEEKGEITIANSFKVNNKTLKFTGGYSDFEELNLKRVK